MLHIQIYLLDTVQNKTMKMSPKKFARSENKPEFWGVKNKYL
jgi:hypothetical protein